MTALVSVALILVASQLALSSISPGLTHASVKTAADVAPLIALLAAPAAAGLAAAPRLGRLDSTAWSLGIMIAVGFAMRAVWFAAPAPFENDFYRYLWDGAVAGAGLSPYALTPEQALLGVDLPQTIAKLAISGRPVLERIDFPDLTSIYPGTAQLAFAVAHWLAPWNIDGLRLLFMLADAATLCILITLLADLRRSPLWAALYWCNPLVIMTSMASAHVDALLPPIVLGAFVAVHRRRAMLSLALLALAAGVKIWPALLAPLLVRDGLSDPRRLFWPLTAFALIAGATLAPLFASSGSGHSGLDAYAANWSNNNAPFAWASHLLHWLWGEETARPEQLLRFGLAGAGGLAAVALALAPVKDLQDRLTRALAITATLFYLSPAQFPWYALWFLPFAAGLQCWPLLLASVTLPIYYLFFPMAASGERELFQQGVAFLHAAPVWAWLLWRRFAPGAVPRVRSAQRMTQAPGELSVGVVIPTKNEAEALPKVLAAIPAWVDIVIVADANSTDGTPEIAAAMGARVVPEPRPGYGRACLSALAAAPPVDVIVFLDGDASDDPCEMRALIEPIASGAAEFVIGSRTLGRRERGALTPQQLFGNRLACSVIAAIWGVRFTDLGPFRAIRADTLTRLALADENYGWTVEMQIRAAKLGVGTVEIPVSYRRRIGVSKVSGTIKGAIAAGAKILYVIAREALCSRTLTSGSTETWSGGREG